MVSPSATTKKITQKYNEKSLKELKYFHRKDPLNLRGISEQGIVEQKGHETQKTKSKIQLYQY